MNVHSGPSGVVTAVRLGPAAATRCRRRVHLDHDPAADRSVRRPLDPGAQLRVGDLAEHRRRVRDALARALPLADGWAPESTERPEAIWAPRLVGGSRFAVPDLLLRAADGGYLPVLVRGHRTLDPGAGAVCADLAAPMEASSRPDRKPRAHQADALALAHVYRLLQELGLASKLARGGVIGRGGPAADPEWDDGALILWHELGPAAGAANAGDSAGSGGSLDGGVLADYDARFADRLAVAAAAASGGPALARPSRIAECRRCPWWPVCSVELEAGHDVSLLVAGADVDVLHGVGVATYDELAALDPQTVAALPLTGIPPADARARALALIAGVPLARRRELVNPPRADVELDVDMESYLDDGAYLWGTYLSGAALPGFSPGYRPFVTWEPLDRPTAGENFVAFWRYLTALREACERAGLTFAAYCYSRKAEERWLYGTPHRFGGLAGMPGRSEIDRFCGSAQWVDLYAEVKRCFVVPGSLRLKRVAAVAGFAWRDPEPSGENSMAWYRIATSGPAGVGDRNQSGDGNQGSNGAPGGDGAPGGAGAPAQDPADADPVAANRARILRYNEDDVLATLALREWMTLRSGQMPTVAELEAGTAVSPAPTPGPGLTGAACAAPRPAG